MAYFKKGPAGQRGIGFQGFQLGSGPDQQDEDIAPPPPQIQSSGSVPHKSSSSRRRSRTPPRRRSRSPRGRRSRSPRSRRSPRRRSRSPRRRYSRSPRRRSSRSPRRRSRSPRKRSRSPRRRSRSPRRRSRSPRRQSRSPRRQSRSPMRQSRSPKRQSRSPRRRSPSPRQSSPDQRRDSSSRSSSPEAEPPSLLSRAFDDVPKERRTFSEAPATDELYEYANEQLGQEENDSDDSDDPLDAFMAGIEDQIKKEDKKKKEQGEDAKQPEKGLRCDIDEEDDQESYFKAMEENPNFVPPEDDDELDVEYDEDGNPIYTPRKKIIEPLPPVDHSLITYPPFGKDFYNEHKEISSLNALQVVQLRNSLGIRVSGFNAPKPVSSFAHFGFDSQTMGIIRKQEYTKPTPIQAQSIPAAMSGRDVIGIARTGSGKTAAYVWPMIPHIMDQEELKPGDGPIAVILAPTRELCIQIHQECRRYGKAFKLRVVCAYGGGNMYEQEKALLAQCEIVVATPGRLIDHVKKKKCPMSRVTYLVLDECDRMFDLGFEPQVTSIVKQCRPDRQILLFSATMRNKISRLCRKILECPVHIQEQGGLGTANQDITQITYTFTRHDEKFDWLTTRLVEFTSTGSVLIFVTRKVNSEEIAAKLRRKDFELGLLHGDMSQFERNEILTSFKKQEFRILVATDVAARGLDIKEIRTVINYDVARDIDTHTHRVGRTGRAGEKGTAYTLVTKSDWKFCGELVKHLEMACQEVPNDLLQLALLDPNFKEGRGNPRKGFGRSTERMRPGLGADSEPRAITAGPMSARTQLGGLNALGGSGTRVTEIKTALKANYMSRFTKASSTTQKPFLPKSNFVASSTGGGNSLYSGFSKASSGSSAPKPSLPLVTPPKKPTFVVPPPKADFKAPPPPSADFRMPAVPPPKPEQKKKRWDQG